MKTSLARTLAPIAAIGMFAFSSIGATNVFADAGYNADADITAIQIEPISINHWDTQSLTFSCPLGAPIATYPGLFLPFRNDSSKGVTATLNGGGAGSGSITVLFTNDNVEGDQYIIISYACQGNVVNPPVAEQPQAVPQQNATTNQSQGFVPAGVLPIEFQAVYDDLLRQLPSGTYASSAQLLSAPAPATVGASGRHLAYRYAVPQIVGGFQSVTLTGVCVSGSIAADPASRSALPVLPRVSGGGLTATVTSGDIGSPSISVTFSNNSRTREIASFRYACS